jgi:hypothetical protein
MTFASSEPHLLFLHALLSFDLVHEKPALLWLFRGSLCVVLINTTTETLCFLLDFEPGCSKEFEDSGLIFSTGMYPLQPGVCFGVADLPA